MFIGIIASTGTYAVSVAIRYSTMSCILLQHGLTIQVDVCVLILRLLLFAAAAAAVFGKPQN